MTKKPIHRKALTDEERELAWLRQRELCQKDRMIREQNGVEWCARFGEYCGPAQCGKVDVP